MRVSNRNLLDLIKGDFILAAVIEFGRPGRGMVGDLLRLFQRAFVLHIGGDPGGAEDMVADLGLNAGVLGPALDHAVSILLPEAIRRQRFRLAARGRAKQRAIRIVRDASGFYVLVKVLL
jgi:hypothetical protein